MIWETIPHLNCLIRTHRAIMQWEEESHEITDTDRWGIFWAYCCRIRKVQACQDIYTLNLINDLRSQLKTHLRGPSLLPNLRFISVEECESQVNLIEMLPIIPAGLGALDLHLDQRSAAGQRLLKHLATIPLARLSDVHISSPDVGNSDAVAKFLQPNDATLVVLNLIDFPLTVSGLKQFGNFPGVKNLILWQKGAATELHEFFDVIALSFPNLRKLDVILDDAIEEDVPVTVIAGLAACGKLEDILLESHRWKSLGREDVCRFGSWWPLMERFNLGQFHYHPDQVTTPLEILQELARVWHRTLRRVFLPFDGSAPLPSPSSVKFKFEKLTELNVGRSRILESGVESVAEFLRTISPGGHLKIIALEAEFQDEEDYAPLWDAVMEKVNAEVSVHSNVVPT
ncbi:hypothetical protein FS837_002859 [Tulasnella sp. UAMH 9824]|nr:hypothetical protein FS837_002859 [Tulasnella sp. UAMH 9824]